MFDWSDYLRLAERLASEKDEASWRAAISRAYYAAFCTACTHAPSFRPMGDDAKHDVVWNAFVDRSQKNPPKVDLQIQQDGRKLKSKRHHADYKACPPLTQADAADAIRLAAKLLAAFDRRATSAPASP